MQSLYIAAKRVGRLVAAGAVIGSIGLCSAQPADAGVYTYSSSPSFINCGVLSLDSSGQINTAGQFTAIDPAPAYPFFILNERTDIKPAGWNLRNPLAPTTVTSDITNAYAYPLGQAVTPSMAAYWRVSLPSVANSYAAGADPLREFNVLFISSNSTIGLSRTEREVLREFVDEGGTLWIENQGVAQTILNDPDASNTPGGLFVDAQFNWQSPTPNASTYAPDNDHRHPLVTTPYFLTNRQLMREEFEEVRRAENRTRSELVREALRAYFERRVPVVEATKAERAALRSGRVEIKRGDYVNLAELHNELDPQNRKTSQKRARKNSR